MRLSNRKSSGYARSIAVGSRTRSIFQLTGQNSLSLLNQIPEIVRIQLHHGELERLIASCMDEVYALAKSGDDNDRKMQLVGIELRARVLLERYKKLTVN